MPKELVVKIDQGDKKLSLLKMEKGQSITLNSEGYEVGLIILSGTATVTVGEFVAENKGSRKDVYSGQPTAIYIPREQAYTITATGYGVLEIALCMAKTETMSAPFIVEAEEIEKQHRGVFNWKRQVSEIFVPEKNKEACGIMAGEIQGCPGNWSIYPYEEDTRETIFLFRLSPNPGKKVQVMGKAEDANGYWAGTDTVMAVSGGYLPIANPTDCTVYGLWFKI